MKSYSVQAGPPQLPRYGPNDPDQDPANPIRIKEKFIIKILINRVRSHVNEEQKLRDCAHLFEEVKSLFLALQFFLGAHLLHLFLRISLYFGKLPVEGSNVLVYIVTWLEYRSPRMFVLIFRRLDRSILKSDVILVDFFLIAMAIVDLKVVEGLFLTALL